ncbi:hypothetical protein [Streptomyces sp. NPDC051211]|uniref:hypothetical protein n=1 Tax=Streptomyces sp. NPDC051211 TaxID=3154643 RepID=UPI00344D1F79
MRTPTGSALDLNHLDVLDADPGSRVHAARLGSPNPRVRELAAVGATGTATTRAT